MVGWRKHIPVAKAFIEKEFGRGMASAKVAGVPHSHKLMMNEHGEDSGQRLAGLQISRGERKRKQVVFIAQKEPEVLIHELSHAAVSRKKSIKGLPPYAPAEEAVASSVEFEWIKANNPKYYARLIKEGRKLLIAKKRNELSSYDAGLAAATLIENVSMKEDRIKLRKWLSEEIFLSKSSMLASVRAKCADAQAKRGFTKLIK